MTGITGIEIATSIVAIFAAVALILNKFGLLRLGKEAKKQAWEPCSLHGEMDTLVKGIKTIQTQNVMRHEQHEQGLREGKDRFEKIMEKMEQIGEDVAVLLDRGKRHRLTNGELEQWRG